MQVKTQLVPRVLIFPNIKNITRPTHANHSRAKGRAGVGRVPADSQIGPPHARLKECPFSLPCEGAGAAGPQPDASYLLVCLWLFSRAPWKGTAGWCPATWSNPLGSSAGKTPPAPGRGAAHRCYPSRPTPEGAVLEGATSNSSHEAGPPWQVTPRVIPMMGSSLHFCTARAVYGEETTLPKASSSHNQFAPWHIYTIINLSHQNQAGPPCRWPGALFL